MADDYIGIDWSSTPHSLKADIVADLNEPLPVESDLADAIVSISVLEHLRRPEVMLSEAYRVLKPGGYLVLQVPFMWHIHEAPYDYFRYTKFGLEYLLSRAGFGEIQIEPTTGFWLMSALKMNYQSTRLLRGPKFISELIGLLLWPLWSISQRLGIALDRWWQSESETAGYFVVARKQS